MSFSALLVHDVEIVDETTGSTDRYGDDVPGESTHSEKARIEPASNLGGVEELLTDRDTLITDLVMYVLPTTLLTGRSEVIWDSKRYRVRGEIRNEYAGTSSPHHRWCLLELVEG